MVCRALSSGLVKEHFKVDLFSGHLFVFFNRRRDYVKILMWDNDGLSLWCKKHEEQGPSEVVYPEFDLATDNPCVGISESGFLVRETSDIDSRRSLMDGDRNVRIPPPPRLKRNNIPLSQFWGLLKQDQREAILQTLSRVAAKQLVVPPQKKEASDE